MPRRANKVPSYCHHKPSGRAVVYVHRKPHYLGRFGSTESYEAYEQIIAEWRQTQSRQLSENSAEEHLARLPSRGQPDWRQLTVNELLLRYFEFAATYYVDSSGATTHEYHNLRYAARPLRELYGRTLVRNFGPRDLKLLRAYLVQGGKLCRQVINRRINRIRRIFRWAVGEEIAPPGSYEALRAIDPLKAGRTVAREALPVTPVPQPHVDAVLAVVTPQVRAMIQLQQLAGMRPQDVVGMRLCDIDRSGDIWVYQPTQHKNRWRGQLRRIFFGPLAQQLLTPFLNRAADSYLFSPREAEQWRNDQRRRARKTPLTPSQKRRCPKPNPKRSKRVRYDEPSYRGAIEYGIAKANRLRAEQGLEEIPHWFPNQLRHARASEIRGQFGLEAAQLVLGQKNAEVTQIYARRDEERAMQIAREVG